MNSKHVALLFFIVAFYNLGFSQIFEEDRISENEFYNEKKADAKSTVNENNISEDEFFKQNKVDNLKYVKEINKKYRKAWAYMDYQTGDASTYGGFFGHIEKVNDNYFEIVNNDATKTDIWVTFLRITSENSTSIERKCFVKFNESFKVKNLRAGVYKLNIEHGNKWKQPLDFTSKGRFMENYTIQYASDCSKTFTLTKYNNVSFTTKNDKTDCINAL